MLNTGFRSASLAPRMTAINTTRGGGVIIRARTDDGVSLEEIAARAPAVFAEGAHASRSARYHYVDTREVLGGLLGEGFKIAEVRQGGSRIEGKREFTKHAIRLTAPDAWTVETRQGDRTQVQVVLINSHDGTSSYRLRAGAYRFLCLNGLVVGDDFEDCRVGHVSGAKDKIIDAAYRVVEDFPRVVHDMREMSGVSLSQDEQRAFARAALHLRWEPQAANEGEAPKPTPIDADALIMPRRTADVGDSLWLTLNRAQEGLIKGGQHYRTRTAKGRTQNRTVGAVNGIDQDSAINRALWTLADEMRKLKAA